MNLCSVLARAAILFDPGVGLLITSVLGSLGAAGAAITVTHYFLGFLKNQENEQTRFVEAFQDHHAESQRKFQDQLDQWANRQQENQHDFQAQISRMTESHNVVLRDAIVTMRRMENAIDGSSATIHGMQKSIGSVGLTVRAIDVPFCDTAQE